jgi:hypothetical protein
MQHNATISSFALGLTKTAVEGTLSLVKSTVEEEKKLREKVQNDLVFISGEFEMMQSFLRAVNHNNKNDQVALTWVRQLRNLAFDVEDCVEYVIHLDLDHDKSSRWGWLRHLWTTTAHGRGDGRHQAAQGQGGGREPEKHSLQQPHPPRRQQQ